MTRTPNNGRFNQRGAGIIRGVFIGIVVLAVVVVALLAIVAFR